MNRILIATTNPAKLAEYRILLRQMEIDLEPVSLADAGITDVPEETGPSARLPVFRSTWTHRSSHNSSML